MTCVLSAGSFYTTTAAFESDSVTPESPPEEEYPWMTVPRYSAESASITCCCRQERSSKVNVAKLDTSAGRLGRQVRGQDEEMKEVSLRSKGSKRRLNDIDHEIFLDPSPPKRISPFLNTPKERKEERRKILRISIQKFRQMEDPEHFLRRSVLINNTLRRVQREIREEKQKSYKTCMYRLRPSYDYDVINNCYLPSNDYISMFEDQIPSIDLSDKLIEENSLLCNGDQGDNISSSDNQSQINSCPPPLKSAPSFDPIEVSDSLCSHVVADDLEQDSVGKTCSDLEDEVFNNLVRALGET